MMPSSFLGPVKDCRLILILGSFPRCRPDGFAIISFTPTVLKRISISMRRTHLRLSLCRGIHFCRIRILTVETTLVMRNIWAINWSTTHGHALTVCRLACATDILPQTEALHFAAADLSHQHFPVSLQALRC